MRKFLAIAYTLLLPVMVLNGAYHLFIAIGRTIESWFPWEVLLKYLLLIFLLFVGAVFIKLICDFIYYHCDVVAILHEKADREKDKPFSI